MDLADLRIGWGLGGAAVRPRVGILVCTGVRGTTQPVSRRAMRSPENNRVGRRSEPYAATKAAGLDDPRAARPAMLAKLSCQC